jgi:hypothetical protein
MWECRANNKATITEQVQSSPSRSVRPSPLIMKMKITQNSSHGLWNSIETKMYRFPSGGFQEKTWLTSKENLLWVYIAGTKLVGGCAHS